MGKVTIVYDTDQSHPVEVPSHTGQNNLSDRSLPSSDPCSGGSSNNVCHLQSDLTAHSGASWKIVESDDTGRCTSSEVSISSSDQSDNNSSGNNNSSDEILGAFSATETVFQTGSRSRTIQPCKKDTADCQFGSCPDNTSNNSSGEGGGGEDELREACGVFGCVLATGAKTPDGYLASTIMDALVALQHRGQESAGIVTSDGRGSQQFRHHRGLGLVANVFSQEKLATLTGTLGLGHTRYSTAGGGDLNNAQPFMVHTSHGQLAIAHNGELINASALRRTVLERGVGLSTQSDSELITQILSLTPLRGEHNGEADWKARIRLLMEATPTSYSLALMNEDKIYGVRDPFGNRPLCVGVLHEVDEHGSRLAGNKPSKILGYILSSESCAFTSIGASFLREVRPGEIVELSPRGVRRVDLVFRPQSCHPMKALSLKYEGDDPARQEDDSTASLSVLLPHEVVDGTESFLHDIENVPPAFCIFEYVYFSRPDSYFEGQQVYSVRLRCGQTLARESPVDVDIVSCVPESATPAARGYAMQLNIPYVDVLHKSRYVGRTFIQPCVKSRKRSVAQKFSAITENVRGRRVVLVDDSVVRGTTIQPIVKLIRDAGAKEVHFRVASPPIRHPCYMGINIPTKTELVANKVPFSELAKHFGVDSLQYLSIEGLTASVAEGAIAAKGEVVGHCTACLSGLYPVLK